MDKLLTVVVPVYKVEKYINKCLDSLIVPDELMEQLEVIVVNDGTPDKSAEMAREYEKKYPQTFRVIDKENGGHGSAWNRGLKEATGKYLRFLDSDDWFVNENFASHIHLLKLIEVDIVFSNSATWLENTQKLTTPPHELRKVPDNCMVNANEYQWNIEEVGMNFSNFHYCTYRTSLLQPCYPLFLEKQFYDDAILFIVPILLATTIYNWKETVYIYRLGREGQTMEKETMLKRYRDFEHVISSQISFIKTHPVVSESKNRIVDQIMNVMIAKQWERLSFLQYKDSQGELTQFKDYLNIEYPNYRKSKKMKLYGFLPFPLYWHVVNKIMKE